jgi:glyoxylase-like metal-dependent hydrolase (beta-lactamase superfamily II)
MISVKSVAAVSFCLLVAACSDARGPAIKADYPVAKVTDHVFVIEGPAAFPNKENQGFMNNPGFVVTSRGVVVIDPGSSVQIGEMVLAKLRTITDAPVIAVFNTHIHGDHWLGNQAILAAHPKAVIYAHPRMRAKTEAAGAQWMQTLMELTGGAVKGTQPVPPNADIDDDETLALGDRHFRIYHNGVAHTDGDIMIEVVEDRVLFAGDNLFNGRAPRLDDGHYVGNVGALDIALKSNATRFVPGHGKVGGREIVAAYKGFLDTLYASVKKHYDDGVSDFDMKPQVAQALAPYASWTGFDDSLGKLVSLAYLEVEAESFK